VLYCKNWHNDVKEPFNFFYAPPSLLVSANLTYSDKKHQKETSKERSDGQRSGHKGLVRLFVSSA